MKVGIYRPREVGIQKQPSFFGPSLGSRYLVGIFGNTDFQKSVFGGRYLQFFNSDMASLKKQKTGHKCQSRLESIQEH